MTSFLDLPPEIRNLIYGYCLVVGKAFVYKSHGPKHSHLRHYVEKEEEKFQTPATSILRGCKLIHDEAVCMLYSKNTLILPTHGLWALFFERALHNAERRSWVKSVEAILESRNLICQEDQISNRRVVVVYGQLEELQEELLEPETKEDYDIAGYDDHPTGTSWEQKAESVVKIIKPDKLVFDLRDHCCPFLLGRCNFCEITDDLPLSGTCIPERLLEGVWLRGCWNKEDRDDLAYMVRKRQAERTMEEELDRVRASLYDEDPQLGLWFDQLASRRS